jgi:hypothetical protein
MAPVFARALDGRVKPGHDELRRYFFSAKSPSAAA